MKPPCLKVKWVSLRGPSEDYQASKHLGGSSWCWSPPLDGCRARSCAGTPPGWTSRRTAFENVTPWSSECAEWDSWASATPQETSAGCCSKHFYYDANLITITRWSKRILNSNKSIFFSILVGTQIRIFLQILCKNVALFSSAWKKWSHIFNFSLYETQCQN